MTIYVTRSIGCGGLRTGRKVVGFLCCFASIDSRRNKRKCLGRDGSPVLYIGTYLQDVNNLLDLDFQIQLVPPLSIDRYYCEADNEVDMRTKSFWPEQSKSESGLGVPSPRQTIVATTTTNLWVSLLEKGRQVLTNLHL